MLAQEILDNRVTIRGENYYMVSDFAKAINKEVNAVYQMVSRNTIKKTLKMNKTIFIHEDELKDRVNIKVRNLKMSKIFNIKKPIESMTDDELLKLRDVLNNL